MLNIYKSFPLYSSKFKSRLGPRSRNSAENEELGKCVFWVLGSYFSNFLRRCGTYSLDPTSLPFFSFFKSILYAGKTWRPDFDQKLISHSPSNNFKCIFFIFVSGRMFCGIIDLVLGYRSHVPEPYMIDDGERSREYMAGFRCSDLAHLGRNDRDHAVATIISVLLCLLCSENIFPQIVANPPASTNIISRGV